MTELSLDALTQRLNRPEKQNRNWKLLGSFALVTLSLVLLLGAAGASVPGEIRAKRFVVVDNDGNEVATLGQLVEGWPWLGLSPKGGKVKGEIGLGVNLDGEPYVALWGKNEFNRVWLTVAADGVPRISLLKNLVPRAVLTVIDKGPSLVLYDERERERNVVGHSEIKGVRAGTVERRSASSLVLFNSDGKVIWKAP